MSDKERVVKTESVTYVGGDAAEIARLRHMMKVLIDTGSVAKSIVMVTVNFGAQSARDSMTAITTTHDDVHHQWMSDAIEAGIANVLLAIMKANKKSDPKEPS